MVVDNSTEKTGGIARLQQDPASVTILEAEEKKFRVEMDGWVLNRYARESPPLTDTIKDVMIEGYNRMTDGFDYANSEHVKNRYTQMVQQDLSNGRPTMALPSLVRDVPALWLEGRLQDIAEIRTSPDAGRIVRALLGSTIIRAVNTATRLGVPNAYVRYKLCGGDIEAYLDTVAERAEELRTAEVIRTRLDGFDPETSPRGSGQRGR